ncbi:MAG TPA: FGGY family carbohydrate kinase [Clostridiales bacterium]|nr:FGGY family carbohydrate kinase [Clostridiales bacterium]
MYVIGIDVGTTGTKAMLINDKGIVLKSAYRGYGIIKSGRNMVEQKAEDWWNSLVETVKECIQDVNDRYNILALSISSQGGSLVPVDKEGNPLSNVIVWMDKRGIDQQNDLLNLHPGEFYYKKTGWKLSPGGNLIQIKWLKENASDLFEGTYKFLSTLDFINFKLTGRYVIDPTNGAMTHLIDINRGLWDEELLSAAGINEKKLAEVMEPGLAVGELAASAAEELGLGTTVKVINGGHDQYCAAVGAGAIEEGELFLSTGTAWVLLGTFKQPVFDLDTYIAPGRHIVNNLWGGLVSVPTGGVSMEWFKDNFASESFRDIDNKASLLMKRAENVFFYPYFNGSGYPNYNPNVKASLMGLGLEHDRYDMALAIMEGVAFEINHAIEEFRNKGCKTGHLRMLGGGSKSNLWTEIIANVTGAPVLRFKETEAACIGAAIIAGVGCGIFPDYRDGYTSIMREEILTEADKNKSEFYREKYAMYKQGIKFIEEYYNKIFN